MARWIVLAYCAFMIALGATGFVAPDVLVGIARRFASPVGIWIAAALRVVLGVALIFAAPGARVPTTMRVVGILVVIAGLLTPVFELSWFRGFLEWWFGHMRLWAGIAVVVGAALAYGVSPARYR
jgi:hypothetical protein